MFLDKVKVALYSIYQRLKETIQQFKRIPASQKVELSKLKHILEPGNYKGSGFYEPTSNYPDGLKTKLFMVIKKTNNGLNCKC